MLAAVILAGGRSLRMGRSKATLSLGADVLLAHVVRAVRPLVDDVVIVAAPDQAMPLDADPMVRVVSDRVRDTGPLLAMARGLEAIRGDAAFALACDAPFVRAEVLRALAARLGPADAGVVP